MKVKHRVGHGKRSLVVTDRGTNVYFVVSSRGVQVSGTSNIRNENIRSLSDWFNALMDEGSESGSYADRFELLARWAESLPSMREFYPGPGSIAKLREFVPPAPVAVEKPKVERRGKYEYPPEMTKAQKRAFRAKARRGK